MGQAYQVTIVLKLGAKKDKTITRERGILTHSNKRLVTPQREEYDGGKNPQSNHSFKVNGQER